MGSASLELRDNSQQRGQTGWPVITAIVLDGISSRHTRRAYLQALDEFLVWFQDEPGRLFNKAAVQKYRAELETKGLAPSSINVRLSAIRRLAVEAADNGLIAPELAAAICRARGAKQVGIRLGHWLTKEEVERLLATPDPTTIKGIRDRALLAILIGAGLRRSELAGLNCEHIQQRDGRWLIADLVGKQGRVRSVPLPDWAHVTAMAWKEAAGIDKGPLFRRITRHAHITPARLSPQAVFTIVKAYADMLGMVVRPHDLRRTFAKLAYIGQSPLEQIQFSLGHASVVTTELYLGTKQDLQDAPCDRLGIATHLPARPSDEAGRAITQPESYPSSDDVRL